MSRGDLKGLEAGNSSLFLERKHYNGIGSLNWRYWRRLVKNIGGNQNIGERSIAAITD